jgi:predicted nucleotidyltransferase
VVHSVDVGGPLLRDLEELRRRLAPYVGRARTVIAFGSVARGDPDEWSDLDLIIVTETSRPFLERFKDFAGLYDVWPRLDLLIYTPAEFAHMIAEENPLVVDAIREGVVLHSAA